LLILGLVVLGPEKLPPALRKMGQIYGQFKRITGDAQSEFRGAFAEPLRDMQKAANEYKTVFTDASNEIEKEYIDTTSIFAASAETEKMEDVVEPTYIPYEPSTHTVLDSVTEIQDTDDLEPKVIPYENPERP
jgi:Sec-independent protein translocase protein TatA